MPSGAVLCGGRSTRMGRDKAFVEVDGMAMVARVAAALRASGCEPVVAVGGDRGGLESLGLAAVADEHPGDGPLGGIITALEHAPADVSAVVVVSCDLPWLTADVIGALLAGLGRHDVAVATAGRRHPTCAAWQPTAAAKLRPLFAGGERAVHRALAALDAVDVEVDPGAVRNVNAPADLLGRGERG